MNVNVNANSLPVNLNNNLLSGVNKLNIKGIGKNSFTSLLSKMLGNINSAQSTVDADITEILTGLKKQNISLSYEDLGLTKSDMLAFFNSVEESDRNDINKNDNVNMSNLFTMIMGSLQNPSCSDAKNIVSQISSDDANQIFVSSPVVAPYLNIMSSQENLGLSKDGSLELLKSLNVSTNDAHNPLNSIGDLNNQQFISKLIALRKNVTEQKVNTDDAHNENTVTINSDNSENPTGDIISKSSSLKEMLSSEIKKHKEDLKNELDLSRIALSDKKIIFKDNNRIIKVSDESSQIKPSVLSQINDKIMIMVKDGSQKVKMKLFPEKLGEIDIKMSFENHKIKIEIMASNKETEKLLISHADELTSILNKSNDSFANVVVKPSENQFWEFNQNNFEFNYQKNGNANQHSRKSYEFNADAEAIDDESLISEIINLRNLKLNKIV